jgi:uncharacterized coiled-coil protein SlyX
VEAARIRWRPLGRLLVEQGLLSEAQLEHALEEQESTGRRLGETLVELEFVSHAALSHALAEQYGFEPKAETGFGTGLRAELERRYDRDSEQGTAGQPSSDAVPALRLVPAQQEPVPPAVGVESVYLAQLEEQWAKLAEAEAELAEAERELASVRRSAERRRDQVRRLVERVRRRDRRIAELSAIECDAPAHSTHLVYAQLAARYVLVECDGSPPEPDTILQLSESGEETERLVVCRIGRSPLLHDPRPCVFAQRASVSGVED